MLSASYPLEGALSEEHHTPTQTHRMDKYLLSAPPLPLTLYRTRPAGLHLSYVLLMVRPPLDEWLPHTTTNTNTNYYDGPTSDRKGIQ